MTEIKERLITMKVANITFRTKKYDIYINGQFYTTRSTYNLAKEVADLAEAVNQAATIAQTWFEAEAQ